jgi:hypothetical protein
VYEKLSHRLGGFFLAKIPSLQGFSRFFSPPSSF